MTVQVQWDDDPVKTGLPDQGSDTKQYEPDATSGTVTVTDENDPTRTATVDFDLPLPVDGEAEISVDKTEVDSSGDLTERTITVDGTGFPATTEGTVALHPGAPGSGGAAVVSVAVDTDADGAFTGAALVVPEEQAEGDYHIVATVGSVVSDDTAITVTAGPPVGPEVTTDKDVVDPGGDETERTILVSGTGFEAETAGTAALHEGEPGSGGAEVVSVPVETDVDGAFSDEPLIVPAEQAEGDYHIVVEIGADVVDDVAITVTGEGPVEPEVSVDTDTVDSSGDETERTIGVSGSGFVAEETGTISLNEGEPGSGGAEVVSEPVTTDEDGAFDAVAVVVPQDQEAGDYHIVVEIGEDVVDDTPITVTFEPPVEPAIEPDVTEIDSTQVDDADRTITVSGTGFEPEGTGTLALNEGAPESGGAEVVSEPVETDAEGAFADVAIIVPLDQVAGDYHLVATVGETVSDDTAITVTGGAEPPVMDVPANVAAGTPTETTIPVTWDAVTTPVAAESYVVRWSPEGEEDWTERTAVTDPEDEIDGLTASTAYDIEVKAQATDHTDSDWSVTITATTAAA